MTFHFFKGSSSWELQIWKAVFQVPYRRIRRGQAYDSWLCRNFGLHVWLDPYG